MELGVFFKEVGGDYENVISRLPNDDMIKKFLRKFPADPSFENVKNAYNEKDINAAFMAAHTLKGTAANLGLDKLAETAAELTEKLRGAEVFPEEKYFKAVENAYELTACKIALLD